METSLTSAYRKRVRDKDGRLVDRFDGEFYFFGSSPPSKHIDHVRFDLLGRTVAMHRETAEKLCGKRLTVVQSDRIEGVEHTRDILVVEASGDDAKET